MSSSNGTSEVFEGAIGIDLGTTYSCISVFMNDVVDIIPNDQGNRTTPSQVAFHNGQILVGDAALNLSVRGVKNVVYDAKRMIGRKFLDKEIAADRAIWPFEVVASADGHDDIRIRIENATGDGSELLLAPEEISAHVLSYLKGCAERHLGKQVQNVVITVPAYFNDAQRERTRAAGTIAGLNVVRIVNEPTAAALCYGIGSNITAVADDAPPKNVLVFDFGGGTFDVSVITIDHGAFEVRSTAGHTHLGGQDVDAAVVKYMLADCKKKHQRDFSEAPKVLAKFRLVAEKAKKALSFATQHEIVVEGVLDGDEYSVHLSRAKLEELCTPLLEECMKIVTRALTDSKLSKGEIHEVIMVGGSSRIPKLRHILEGHFGRAPCCSVNPDEAIAAGAGIQASILSRMKEQKSAKTDHVVLMDVLPLSIGVDVDQGKFDVLIPRNTTIPYKMRKEYSTFENNQTEVDVEIFEGERPLTKHNHRLGSFALTGITRAKKGVATIIVEFDVDANGILTVRAEEEGGKRGARNSLVVKNEDRLTSEDIAALVKKAEEMRAMDAVAARVHQLVADATQALEDTEDAFEEFVGQHYKWNAAEGARSAGGDGDGSASAEGAPVAGLPPKLHKKRAAVQAALHWFRQKSGKIVDEVSLVELEARAKKAAALAAKAAARLAKFAGKAFGSAPAQNASKKRRKRSSDDDDEDEDEDDQHDASESDATSESEVDDHAPAKTAASGAATGKTKRKQGGKLKGAATSAATPARQKRAVRSAEPAQQQQPSPLPPSQGQATVGEEGAAADGGDGAVAAVPAAAVAAAESIELPTKSARPDASVEAQQCSDPAGAEVAVAAAPTAAPASSQPAVSEIASGEPAEDAPASPLFANLE